MEEYQTITAKGSGFWSTTYRIELFTSSKIYRGRFKAESQNVINYGFSFKKVNGGTADKRLFKSLSERTDFLAKNVTNLQLLSIKRPKQVRLPYLLDSLIGENLSSVSFVMDYLQLDFNGNRFSFYNWPVIRKGVDIYHETDPEYRNELYALINRSVICIDEYLDIGLTIEFEGNLLLCTPLKVEAAYSIPEIVEFNGRNGEWMIWQVGDQPFR